jgi:hypothetical protein
VAATAEIKRTRVTTACVVGDGGEGIAAISPLQAIAQAGEIFPFAQSPQGMSHGGISSEAAA